MKKEKKSLIVYHKDDNDGVFSTALIQYHLLNLVESLRFDTDDIELLPADYGILSEKWKSKEVKTWPEKYEHVFLTDLSFNDWKAMKFLADKMKYNFIWFDHHAPAIAESVRRGYDNVEGFRETYKSAILLVYEHYFDPLDIKFNDGRCPRVLGALSAYDCWNWNGLGYNDEECKCINVAVNVMVDLDIVKALGLISITMSSDGERIESEDDSMYNMYVEQGYRYRKYQKYEWKQLMRQADLGWKVGDRSAAAVFIQGPSNSMMFDTIKDGVECGIVFKIDSSSNVCVVSLYNVKEEYDEEFDCGRFMKENYHGGGHRGSAGATIKLSKLNKLLKTKTL